MANNYNNLQDNLSFEKAIEKLEKLVSQMEQGKLPLEEMMQKFEEANKLASFCSAKLKEVEQKIELLVSKNATNPKFEDFYYNEPQTKKNKITSSSTNNSEENNSPSNDSLF